MIAIIRKLYNNSDHMEQLYRSSPEYPNVHNGLSAADDAKDSCNVRHNHHWSNILRLKVP